jgi:hypothetical protein
MAPLSLAAPVIGSACVPPAVPSLMEITAFSAQFGGASASCA